MAALRIGLTLVLLSAACGESHVGYLDAGPDSPAPRDTAMGDTDVSDATEPRVPEEVVLAFFEEWTEATCEWTVRCEPVIGIADFYQPGHCHPHGRRLLSIEPALEVEYWRAGYTQFDTEAAAACLERFRSGGCGGCQIREVFVAPGLGEPGDDCSRGCNEESRAEYDDSWRPPGDCSPRECTCQPLPAEGESCAFHHLCLEGLVCDEANTCVRPPPLGASCRGPRDCAAGAVCREDECRASPLALGDECTGSCGGGLLCTRRDEAGGICTTGEPEGATCDYYTPCALHHRCDEGICRYVALPGESCTDALCPHSFFCDEGRCAPRPVHGEPCHDATSCAQGVCTEGTCVALEGGSACEPEDFFVAFGSCETGACVTGVCPSFVGEGEPCGGGNVVCSVFRGFAVGELFCSIQDDCSEICERLLL